MDDKITKKHNGCDCDESCGCEHNHNEDEHCGCGHEHNTITITTFENEELKCDIIGIFDVDNTEYIALLPQGDDEVLIYRFISHNDDDIELLNIEDDDEFEKASETFFSLYGQNDDEDFEE